MNDIIIKQDIYALLETGIRESYKYEGRAFVAFLRENGLGFELDALQAWKDYCLTKGYAARTVNRKIMIAKMLFRHVIETAGDDVPHGKREAILSALDEVKKLKEPRPAVENKILTESEMIAFLDAAETMNPEIALMSEFLWRTGLRVSEMLGIRVSDVKQISSTVYEIRLLGKGSKERNTWIDADFLQVLRRFFRPSDFLFQRQDKRRRSRSYVSMNIKRLASRILDRRNIAAHSLRHSYATNGLEKGRSLQWVSQALGHSDIQTTSRYYAHISVKAGDVLQTVDLKRERHFTTIADVM
jgi:site-specific recombinase XerD